MIPTTAQAIRQLLSVAVLITSLLAVIALSGCELGEPCRPYIESERGIYNALAPELWRYVEADTLLLPEHRQLELMLLKDWREGLEAFESLLGIEADQ